MNDKEIATYPTQIKAYVDDGFDFIIEKPEDANQFVGVWNYETMEFIMDKSSFALAREIAHKYISLVDTTDNIKQPNENTMFNQDYNNTQNYFNLGCDFRILTSSFKDIEVYPLSMPISVRIDENV
ncbi:hypothetical protein CQA44_04505 [Helicobacter sp. MIT 14-3879]|nr:hypothetical protein CQA44_04505 [Helicobacter sp. MIT 14-3879]